MKMLRFLAVWSGCLLVIPAGTFGQSYSPVRDPGTELFLYAGCVNWSGGPTNCTTNIFTTAYQGTNGHTTAYHVPQVPPSSWIRAAYYIPAVWKPRLDNHSIIGQETIKVKFGQRGCMNTTAPVTNCTETQTTYFEVRQAIGQPERISNCIGSNCAHLDLGVIGYSPIYWVDEKPEFIRVGKTKEHMDSNDYNHWMREIPAIGIWNATKDYLARHPEQGRLALNDMSLAYGGLFDIAGRWRPSHWEHNNGKSVDVRANCFTSLVSG